MEKDIKRNIKDKALVASPFRQSFLTILQEFVDTTCNGNVSEASRALGIQSRGLLAQWLKGEKMPRLDSIVAIMDKLGYDIAASGPTIPIYSVFDVSRSKPLFSMTLPKNRKGVFGIEWQGASMSPTIEAGELVGIDPHMPLVWGEMHAVVVNQELLIRTIMPEAEGYALLAQKELFTTKVAKADCEILGKVCWVLKNY